MAEDKDLKDTLQDKNPTPPEVSKIPQTPGEQEDSRYAAQQAQIDELKAALAKLTGKPATTSVKHELPKGTVKAKGKEWKFNLLSFAHHKHGKVFADEAIHDPELVEDIISIPGQNVLTEV